MKLRSLPSSASFFSSRIVSFEAPTSVPVFPCLVSLALRARSCLQNASRERHIFTHVRWCAFQRLSCPMHEMHSTAWEASMCEQRLHEGKKASSHTRNLLETKGKCCGVQDILYRCGLHWHVQKSLWQNCRHVHLFSCASRYCMSYFMAFLSDIHMLSSGWQSSRDWKDGDKTYAGMVEVSRALMMVHNHHVCLNQHAPYTIYTHACRSHQQLKPFESGMSFASSQQVDTLAGPLSCRAEGCRHPGLSKSAPLVPEAVSILKVGCRAQCADYTRLFHMAGWAHEDTGGHCRQCCCAAEWSPHRALQVQSPHMLLLMFMLVLCVAIDCESISCHTQSGGAKLNERFTPVLQTDAAP